MSQGDMSPLIDATRHGRVGDVRTLLANGADVNEPRTFFCEWFLAAEQGRERGDGAQGSNLSLARRSRLLRLPVTAVL